MNDHQPAGGVAAVDRAVAILSAFGDDDQSLSLAELATRTGLYKSTILRLADSLLRGRLLLRLENGSFRIGPEALRLGALYQRGYNVGAVLMPIMRDLADRTGESVVFYVREGGLRTCLLRVESPQPVRLHVHEGQLMPIERGSGGIVLRAFEGTQDETSDKVRRDFYYISLGERQADTAGVAAPVFGPRDSLTGSLGISGPISRFNRKATEAALPLLLRAAAQATHELGGDAGRFPPT